MLTRNFFISISHVGDDVPALNGDVHLGVQVVESLPSVVRMASFKAERTSVVAFVVVPDFRFEVEVTEEMVHWEHLVTPANGGVTDARYARNTPGTEEKGKDDDEQEAGDEGASELRSEHHSLSFSMKRSSLAVSFAMRRVSRLFSGAFRSRSWRW